MAGNKKPRQITNFDELAQMYKWHAIYLENKYRESYWLRYLFRRIPLFSGCGLTFFGVCLALALTDTFGVERNNEFLQGLEWLDAGHCADILFVSVSLLFLRSILPWQWFACEIKNDDERIDVENSRVDEEVGVVDADEGKSSKSYRKIWSKHLEKPIAFLLVFSAFLSGFFWIVAQDHALLLGLIIFAVITLGALLADRTLGFTRRNERYQLFANRAEGLIVESRSRKTILDKSGKSIQFNEEHLLDCSAFFEELRQDKHNATMSDSFYVLRLKERLLRATTA